MCDYSLMGLPNRMAREGEELVVHTFRTHTKGMTSVALSRSKAGSPFWGWLKNAFDLAKPIVTAVCIPPGAKLVLRDIPVDLQRSLKLMPAETVTFAQLSLADHGHRDGIRFANGTQLSLQCLADGQRVTVLSLDDLHPENEVREELHVRMRWVSER